MRHMLFRQKALPNVPVPRNDLTKLILASYKDTKKDPKLGNAVIALAQESFPKTIGMEMKELRVTPISKGKSKLAGKVRPLQCVTCAPWHPQHHTDHATPFTLPYSPQMIVSADRAYSAVSTLTASVAQ